MKQFTSAVASGAAVIFSMSVVAENSHIKPEGQMEQILVSVPRLQATAETALPVSVLSGDELRSHVANTIGETLNGKAGLSSASFGPSVGQPVIRGQQGARVSVLQNSMGSGDASSVSADHSVSVEPILAQSIEVLRGPSTLLYGGGAIGGVVNVIDGRVPTTLAGQISGAAEVRHGSVNDETTTVFTVDGGMQKFAWHLDGMLRDSNDVDIPGLAVSSHDDHEAESSDGFIANTDSQTLSYTLGGSYIFSTGYIGLAINHLENLYGIPAGAHGHEEEHDAEEESVRLDIKQTRYDIRSEFNDVSTGIETVRWYFSLTDYQHDELEGAEVGTQWQRDSWENRVEILHSSWNGWRGVMGFQQQQFQLEAIGDESYIPATEVNHYGLFLVESFTDDSRTYELGARLERSELSPDRIGAKESFNSLSLSASLLWQFSQHWNLGVALSSSERAPVTEELYSNSGNGLGDYVAHVATGSIEVGSSDLDREKANNLDVTISYQRDRIDGYLTLFYNDFADYIFLANTGNEQDEVRVLEYQQQGAIFSGVEFEVNYFMGQFAGGDLELDLFGDWLSGELDRAGYVPRLPPEHLGSRLHFERGPVSAYLSVVRAGKQNNPGADESETDGYTRWDAGLSYRFSLHSSRELTGFVRLKNISDEKIRNATSFLRDVAPEAGRSVEAGLRLNF